MKMQFQETARWFDERERTDAAHRANQEDADLWRWFCLAYEEGRIRWCRSHEGWLVSVDHKHLATERDFDAAIRAARARVDYGTRTRPSPDNQSRRVPA
jgi:hypothetical protein